MSESEKESNKTIGKKLIENPWFFIPTLYFAQGIPYIIVNQLSTALFKSLAASNIFIGFTSFLYIPWAIKFLWSPIVDGVYTKRSWLLSMQGLLTLLFFLCAFSFFFPAYTYILLGLLTMCAFVSATHDIAIDGFYMYALDEGDQSVFAGIRSAFYRLAMLFSGGLLVFIAGEIGTAKKNMLMGWGITFILAGFVFLILYIYHKLILPKPDGDVAIETSGNKIPFKLAFGEYFKQDKIWIIVFFILTFRFGEGMLLKMAQPFLMDKTELGGLGIGLSEVGLMYGTFGIIALVAGGIGGGWLVKKYGLKKMIIPLAVIMHMTNLLYVFMSVTKSAGAVALDFSSITHLFGFNWVINVHPVVQLCIVIEQFAYGLGFTSFMVYLLTISTGRYKTSQYAISTGIMALGMIIPGILSGIVQQSYGYTVLFILSFLTTIPGIILLFFLPFKSEK